MTAFRLISHGEAIREARIAAGLSQLDLANAIGCTQGRVWEYEAGRRFPRSAKWIAIAVALGVDLRCSVKPANDAHGYLRRAAAPSARAELNKAIRRGDIARPAACAECGAGSPQAHHPDYGKPFDVEWLCRKCHQRRPHHQNGVAAPAVAA